MNKGVSSGENKKKRATPYDFHVSFCHLAVSLTLVLYTRHEALRRRDRCWFAKPTQGKFALRSQPEAHFHGDRRALQLWNFTRSTEIFIFSFARAGTVQRNFL